MLIKCPECKKMISDITSACSNCGSYIEQFGTITVQETGKNQKLHYIFATILIAVFGVWTMVAISTEIQTGSGIATLGLLVGLVWIFIIKFRVWWHLK